MKLETFFEKFDLFADAPDAVAKMRELVLDLAIQGKLVEPKDSDGDGNSLLQKLRKLPPERNSKTRSPKDITVEPETLLEIPSHWALTTVENTTRETGFFCDGDWVESKDQDPDGDVRLIQLADVGDGQYRDRSSRFMTKAAAERLNCSYLHAGDILVARMPDPLGRCCRFPGDSKPAVTVVDVCILRPNVSFFDPDFLVIAINCPRFRRLVSAQATGTTRTRISRSNLGVLPIPLPPLAEQKRIVAKVDELMALCDRLEAQQQERETRHTALARASLARFADAPTSANLPFLFHSAYAIPPADLRKSILTLAVQGKLVPQDPNDADARAMIVRAMEKRQQLIKSKSLRRKKLAESADLFEHTDLPSSWCVERLANLVDPENTISYGVLVPGNDVPDGIPFVRAQDLCLSNHPPKPNKTIAPEIERPYARTRLTGGEILLCVVGSIGKLGVVPESWAGANIARAVARIKPIPDVLRDYLLLVLQEQSVQNYFTSTTRTLAQPTLNIGMIEQTPIPVPPFAEQRRIVAKVEQLMTLVHALESQLSACRALSGNLLSALLVGLTGNEGLSSKQQQSSDAISMKRPVNRLKGHRQGVKPLDISTKAFTLRRFAMSSGYRSLGQFDCTFHSADDCCDETSPVCLVGLNGSGKSNLIEALAEVFCFLELINLPWKKPSSPTSRFRENRHQFELEYTLTDNDGKKLIRVRKAKKRGADFFIVSEDGSEEEVEPGRSQLQLLPRRVLGYSSGQNETVSHPFLRTKTIYSEEVRDAAPPENVEPIPGAEVFDTRTLYMDYESNAAVIICNYIFQKPDELKVFDKFTRVCGVSSFSLRFNRKRAGKSGANSVVRLTHELQSYLQSFVRCAGSEWDAESMEYSLFFELNPETINIFKEEFDSAEALFMAMHKWSLLNALILSDEQRNVYLSADITKGALERPPSVPTGDRVFNISDLRLRLSEPDIDIDYSGLSDGEHQLMQIIGTSLLFSDPGALFLFDEPESHFNPEWRSKFNLILNGLPNASSQEYIISTHSPFVVSGSRMGSVFKFERSGGDVELAPVQFETYGASFDMLLKNLFSIDSFIDQSAREDLQRTIQSGDLDRMHEAVEAFAESREKRRLYEAIIKQEEAG